MAKQFPPADDEEHYLSDDDKQHLQSFDEVNAVRQVPARLSILKGLAENHPPRPPDSFFALPETTKPAIASKKAKPHYSGHRQRLRERFVNHGDDVLAALPLFLALSRTY